MTFGNTEDLRLRARWDDDEVTRGLRDLENRLDRLDRQRVTPDIDTRRVGSAGKAVDQLNGSLRGLARTAATVVLPIVGIGAMVRSARSAIGAASDLQESISATEQVYRSAAGSMIRWSESAATSLGMTQQQALEGAKAVGAMLVPMGFADREAARMSRTMAQLATDMASFNNEDPTEMLDRLRAGLAGESEPLRRYGVDLRVAAVEQQALADGLIKEGEKLQGATQIRAMYNKILADTKRQSGDFARTQEGLANQERILDAQLGELSATVGNIMLPAFNRAVTFLNREVVPTFRSAAEDIGEVWERDDLTPEQKLRESWQRIIDTGFPQRAGDAILQGISATVQRVPEIVVTALDRAPWPAKAVIAGILLKKLGPVFSLLAGMLVRGGGGGGGGGIPGLAGGPVPVIVTNPGFGAGGGIGGGGGGAAGTAGRAGRAGRVIGAVGRAAPGLGTGIAVGTTVYGAARGAGVPGAGYLGAASGGATAGAMIGSVVPGVGTGAGALIGAGIGVGAVGLKSLLGSKGDREREVRAAQKQIVEEWTREWPKTASAIRTVVGGGVMFMPDEVIEEKFLAPTNRAISRFKTLWTDARPDLRRTIDFTVREAMRSLDEMPEATRARGAKAILEWSQGMEGQGKVARGTTENLRRSIEKEYGKLPPSIRKDLDKVKLEQARLRLDQAKTVRETQQRTRELARAYARFAESHGIESSATSAAAANRVRDRGGEVSDYAHTGGILGGRPGKDILVQALPGERVLTRHQTKALNQLLGGRATVDEVIRRVKRHHSYDVGGVIGGAAAAADLPEARIGGATRLAPMSQQLYDRMEKAAEAKLNDALQAAMPPSSGAGSPAPPGQVRDWLARALRLTGHYSPANLNALYGRAMQESGGNPRAINLWDSNAKAGIPSKGLLQTIGPTFDAYKLPGMTDIWNPVHNAAAAIRYMFARYGRIVGPSSTGYHHGGIVGLQSFDTGGTVAFGSPGGDTWQAGLARKFGLGWTGTRSASRNAAVGGSKTSRHLVPGGAGDFSGSAAKMLALAKWAYNGGQTPFAEIFYDPWGQWDNGRYSASGIGGHDDHVHLSYGRPFSLGAAPVAGSSRETSGSSSGPDREGPEGTPFTRTRDALEALGFRNGRPSGTVGVGQRTGRGALTRWGSLDYGDARNAGSGGMARRLLRGVPDLSPGGDPGFTPAQERRVSAVGRDARQDARNRGVKDPAELARIEREAERTEIIRILRNQVTAAVKDRKRLKAARARVQADFQRVGRRRTKTRAQLQKKRALMDQYRAKLAAYDAEIDDVREEIAQLNQRLMDIGEEIAAEADEAAWEAAQASADGSGSPADTGPVSGPTSEDWERYAAQRAAEAGAAGSLLGAIAGSRDIDPLAGGGTTIIVQNNVEGSLVRDTELTGWLADIMARTPSRPAGSWVSPA